MRSPARCASLVGAALTLAIMPAGAAAATGGFYNVLAAGEGHNVSAGELATYEATGRPPASFTNQTGLYDRLIALAPHVSWSNLGQVFKPTPFGASAADGTVQSPRAGVTIIWDRSYQIPHVYGKSRADVMFGAGYACAEARLFLMDVLRHTARGTLSELAGAGAGNSTVQMDAAQLKFADYSEAELRQQIAYDSSRLGAAGVQAIADGNSYTDGVNQYIRMATANPLLLPAEYAALGQLPAPWKLTDSVAIASLINEQQGSGGGAQDRESQLVDSLLARFRPGRAARVYRDLREANDPDAPVTTLRRFVAAPGGRVRSRSVARLDFGSVAARDPVVADRRAGDGAGPGRGRSGRAPSGPPAWLRTLQTRPVRFPHAESNATLITAGRSRSGHPLFVAGPQVGYYSPEILLEEDLHGGGIDAEGASFPGISEYVLLGRGRAFAWSATSAGSEQEYVFAERLCNPGGSRATRASDHYLYKGRCVPLLRRDQVLHTGPSAANPGDPTQTITLRVERSLHGPIQGTATVRGVPVALALARSTYFHEADAALFFKALNEGAVSSASGFRRAARWVNSSFNWFYADRRDIAYQLSGAYPQLARGSDPNLPIWGTGAYDWRGFEPQHYTSADLPTRSLPGEVNPPRGYLISWNNRPAPGWRAASDTLAWGAVFRSQLLERRVVAALAGHHRLDLPDVVGIMGDAATSDLRGQEVYPWLARVLGSSVRSPRLRGMLGMLAAWSRSGSHRRDRVGSGYYENGAAVALMDAWWKRLAAAYFGASLGPRVTTSLRALISLDDPPGAQGDAFYAGFYGYVQKDLRDLLQRAGRGGRRLGRPGRPGRRPGRPGRPGRRPGRPRQPYSRIYCADGTLRSCRALLTRTLAAAVRDLDARYHSSNPASWRVPVTCQAGQSPPACDQIEFTAAGAIGTPPIPWQNRGTFQQAVEVTGGG